MKKIFMAVAVILVLAGVAFADSDSRYAPSHEAITVSTVAIGGTTAIVGLTPAPQYAYCTVETASIRIRWDGTVPTSSTGHLYYPGDTFIMTTTRDVQHLKMIRTGSSDATVRCSYE